MKKLYKQQNFYLAKEDLESLSSALSQSYADGFGVNLEEGANLPRRREILSVTGKLEELIKGGENMSDFAYASAYEIFGTEDVLVFDLVNDALGYIVPENDYCMALAFGHYQEMLTLGEKEATTMFEAYEKLLG